MQKITLKKSSENVAQKKVKTQPATNNFIENRKESVLQTKRQEVVNNSNQVKQLKSIQAQINHSFEKSIVQKKANNTGLPNQLKSGIENLSGISMDDVKVHYNSAKPAQLQAHAYAQGTDIHLGPGQEKHLPHEAWHVVQQKQGRVKPTMQMKEKVNINDDIRLEREADMMGAKAVQMKSNEKRNDNIQRKMKAQNNVIQQAKITTTKGTIIESIDNEKSDTPGAKEKRGQISKGKMNEGGTPGTPYAKNVKNWTRTADWLGGHIYKHQWGGGITRGNVVVWPNAAEGLWEKGFENRVQASIDKGESTAIGVSWTVNDELISRLPVDPRSLDTPVDRYVENRLEVDRREANDALSYIPVVAAGSTNGHTIVIGAGTTDINQAKNDAIKYLIKRKSINATKFGKDHRKGFFARHLEETATELGSSDRIRSNSKIRESNQDETDRKGVFGNLNISIKD